MVRSPSGVEFTLGYETLRLSDDADQLLITYTAEPGSASEAALRIIAEHAGGRARVTPAAIRSLRGWVVVARSATTVMRRNPSVGPGSSCSAGLVRSTLWARRDPTQCSVQPR
ncbi:hypothetical protein P8605_23845 [Streptomyces sp. T-3]|nr:hypothetical protein [Streptomyces sp. T-3]